MRLIILSFLIVATFVFGFLFAHEPFRNVVIKKTVNTFFSDEAPSKEPERAAKAEPKKAEPKRAEPAPERTQDRLTEDDREDLENLIEEKLNE